MSQEQFDSRDENSMGQLAYESYCDSVGWKSISGDPLPAYSALTLTIRTGWIASARAVATAVRKEQHG